MEKNAQKHKIIMKHSKNVPPSAKTMSAADFRDRYLKFKEPDEPLPKSQDLLETLNISPPKKSPIPRTSYAKFGLVKPRVHTKKKRSVRKAIIEGESLSVAKPALNDPIRVTGLQKTIAKIDEANRQTEKERVMRKRKRED